MKKIFVVLTTVFLVAGLASANERTLKGTYRVTASRGCFQATTIEDGFPTSGGPSSRHGSILGFFHYDGSGAGMAEFETLQVLDVRGVSKSRTTCDIQNVVLNPDGSFTQDLVNCAGTVEEGVSNGFTFDIITPTSHEGQVTSNGKALIWATVVVNKRTITFTPPGGPAFDRQRICHLSGTGVKVKDARKKGDDDRD